MTQPNPLNLPANPAFVAAAEAKALKKRNRNPDVPCEKCDYIARSKAELQEHLIDEHPTGVFGPERQEAYLSALLNGNGRHSSARSLGVSPATVAKFITLNPAFERAVQMAEEEYTERVEVVQNTAALLGEPWAVKEVLSKRNPKRWGAVPQEFVVNHTGTVVNEVELSPQMAKIAGIMANIKARKALSEGDDIIDAEIVDDV